MKRFPWVAKAVHGPALFQGKNAFQDQEACLMTTEIFEQFEASELAVANAVLYKGMLISYSPSLHLAFCLIWLFQEFKN